MHLANIFTNKFFKNLSIVYVFTSQRVLMLNDGGNKPLLVFFLPLSHWFWKVSRFIEWGNQLNGLFIVKVQWNEFHVSGIWCRYFLFERKLLFRMAVLSGWNLYLPLTCISQIWYLMILPSLKSKCLISIAIIPHSAPFSKIKIHLLCKIVCFTVNNVFNWCHFLSWTWRI